MGRTLGRRINPHTLVGIMVRKEKAGVYSPESSGKTTVALHAMTEVSCNGGVVAFIDSEHALDVECARSLGVDIDEKNTEDLNWPPF